MIPTWRLRWKIEKLIFPFGFHFIQYGGRWLCLGRLRAVRHYYEGTEYHCARCKGKWWRRSRYRAQEE